MNVLEGNVRATFLPLEGRPHDGFLSSDFHHSREGHERIPPLDIDEDFSSGHLVLACHGETLLHPHGIVKKISRSRPGEPTPSEHR